MIDWIYKKLLNQFLTSGRLASLVRHGMSAVGGYLMAQGLSEQVVVPWLDPTAELITASIILLASYLMSRMEKSKRDGE